MEAWIEIRDQLERARAGTELLLDPIPDDQLVAQTSLLTSPPIWDYAEIAHFEELWLLRNVMGKPPVAPRHRDVDDAIRRAHEGRNGHPPLKPAAVRAYVEDVRERVFDALEDLDLDTPNALLRNGFVFGLVLQNELQRQESMLQTLQLRTAVEYPVPREKAPDRAPGGPDEILVPAGSFVLGAVAQPWAYDSELVPHVVELRAFRIDRTPVTNRQFAEFVEDNGYGTRRLWTPEGWEWRGREGVDLPLYWSDEGGEWQRVRFGKREPLPPDEPVQHVSWYEADAYARWAGRRLPTEIEWERAAGWHDHEGKFRYPWGQEWMGFEASLDRRRFSPAPAGSYAGGVSPVGCVQMGGDVWEWTSSDFLPYPGFQAFPCPEQSEIFFGDAYRVLRGGSWATDALVARTTFRNWDEPQRRQLFAGFRCARDA